MKKQIEIKVPNDWSAITFKQYNRLQSKLKNYEDEKDAQNMILVSELCDISVDTLIHLDKELLEGITNEISGFLNKTEYPLQKIIVIDGVRYGFEPNLSKMAYGAYLDIAKFKDLQLNDDWLGAMSILYRPIKKKNGALYSIEPYKGWNEWDKEKFESVGMDIHFGGFFFFSRLYKDLLKGILNYTKSQVGMYPSIKSILERSGENIAQLHNLQEKISSSLVK
jgi:hypothetical protein